MAELFNVTNLLRIIDINAVFAPVTLENCKFREMAYVNLP